MRVFCVYGTQGQMFAIAHKLAGHLVSMGPEAGDRHYTQISWPCRTSFTSVLENVKSAYLVDSQNILSPPLHIKLGLMKNYNKAHDKDGSTLKFL